MAARIMLACGLLAALSAAASPPTPPHAAGRLWQGPEGREYCLELAVTPQEQARGYSFRPGPEADEGMWFVYEQDARRKFWMRGVPGSLRITWLDQNWRVVHSVIAPPCPLRQGCPIYGPDTPSRHVIELAPEVLAEVEVGAQWNAPTEQACQTAPIPTVPTDTHSETSD